MNYLAVTKSVLALTTIALITGCGKGSLSIPAVPEAPTYTAPAKCVNISGRWMMNSAYFGFQQTNCEKVTHTNFNNNKVTEFVADKQVREYPQTDGSTLFESSYFTETQFILDRVTLTPAGTLTQKTRKYYMSKRPCNLMNPDGELYLTMEIYNEGSSVSDSCDFWANVDSKKQ